MQSFLDLLRNLSLTDPAEHETLLLLYLASVDEADAAWAVWLLEGRGLATVLIGRLGPFCCDLAHNIEALVGHAAPNEIPDGRQPLAHWINERLPKLVKLAHHDERVRMCAYWSLIASGDLFGLSQLFGGRAVFRLSLARALSCSTGAPLPIVLREMEVWSPRPAAFTALLPDASPLTPTLPTRSAAYSDSMF